MPKPRKPAAPVIPAVPILVRWKLQPYPPSTSRALHAGWELEVHKKYDRNQETWSFLVETSLPIGRLYIHGKVKTKRKAKWLAETALATLLRLRVRDEDVWEPQP